MIKVNCEVVTPIINFGVNDKLCELRTSSLKGSLRFWWRAVRPYLNMDNLREKETEIFGGKYSKKRACK